MAGAVQANAFQTDAFQIAVAAVAAGARSRRRPYFFVPAQQQILAPSLLDAEVLAAAQALGLPPITLVALLAAAEES